MLPAARLLRAPALRVLYRGSRVAPPRPVGLARRYSSQPPASQPPPARLPPSQQPQPPQPSHHTSFWKEFGRPIAKVLLVAVFVYQLAYYGWARLEQEEIRSVRLAELTALEADVEKLQKNSS